MREQLVLVSTVLSLVARGVADTVLWATRLSRYTSHLLKELVAEHFGRQPTGSVLKS